MSNYRRGAEDAEFGMKINELTDAVIGAAIQVHRALGPGLLESTYELCLCRELDLRNIRFERQKSIPVEYKGAKLDAGYRVDLLIDDQLVVELKSVDALPINDAQMLTYLRVGGWQVGLIINFNVQLLKQGIRRKVLQLEEEISF